jgi:xylitol oxidase
MTIKNWSQNVSFTGEIVKPKNISELQAIISENKKIRGIGSRHSFNSVADSKGIVIDSQNLSREIELDSDSGIVAVPSGIPYGNVAQFLEERGLALRNLGSLPHISVVGATATGTHGSGLQNKNLSSSIIKGDLVLASGELITLSDESLPYLRVSLGSLGFIYKIYLKTIPTFKMSQKVYLDLPFDSFLQNFEYFFSLGYSVSAFHTWGRKSLDQLWVKSQEEPKPFNYKDFGARLAEKKFHPISSADSSAATEQMGELGPWNERLPHFKFDYTPSLGDELQTEYFIPFELGAQALSELNKIGDLIAPLLLITELRTVAADDAILSTAYNRDVLAIHFTWVNKESEIRELLPKIELILKKYKARPHPGKVFTAENFLFPQVFPKFTDFMSFRDELDPTRKFINKQLESWGF